MSPLPAPVRLMPVAARHPAAQRYLRARRGLQRRDDAVIPVHGRWAHERLLELGASIEAFLCCRPDGGSGIDSLVAGVAAVAHASYEISEKTLARLHPGSSVPGLLSLVRVPTWSPQRVLDPDARLLLVADGIEYAGNLGTLVRTVDASGADGLVLSNPAARRTHPTVFSASRGTVLTTPTLELPDAADGCRALERAGFSIMVADPRVALDYRDAQYDGGRVAIVVGSEGNGVSDEWRAAAQQRVSISMRGRADSLNVAAAAAILLFEASARSGG